MSFSAGYDWESMPVEWMEDDSNREEYETAMREEYEMEVGE